MNPEIIRQISFGSYGVRVAASELADYRDTAKCNIGKRSGHFIAAIDWLKIARRHVATAEALLARSRALKPLRALSVKAKGGRS